MIYLVAVAVVIAAVGFWRRCKANGLLSTFIDMFSASLLGWVAGLLIGVGARIGMWSIPFFNGTDSRITFDGTVKVILTFSLFGIGLGIVYELVFRRLFRNRGLIFGLLVTLIAAYPLAAAALQQINFTPPILLSILFALIFVGFMFIPFAVLLEVLLTTYHRLRSRNTQAETRAVARAS